MSSRILCRVFNPSVVKNPSRFHEHVRSIYDCNGVREHTPENTNYGPRDASRPILRRNTTALHQNRRVNTINNSSLIVNNGRNNAKSKNKLLLPCNNILQQNRTIWDIFRKKDFGSYDLITGPGEVSDALAVPDTIQCPPYFFTGTPLDGPGAAEIKQGWQVDAMRRAGRLARQVMDVVAVNIKAGMTTNDLDILVHHEIIRKGAYPSPLNYHGFPKSVCTSVNNVACHGIPDHRHIVDGDIVSVDITVFVGGHHGDCCETFLVGEVDEQGRKLVDAARMCRDEAIAICGPGVPFAKIGDKVQEVAKRCGVTVVPAFIGHGIGAYFHGPPDIYHCYNYYPGVMEEGMTFTVEPIVAQGSEEVLILEDGWTAIMTDNGRAAQFEHTILITNDGHDILTDYIQ